MCYTVIVYCLLFNCFCYCLLFTIYCYWLCNHGYCCVKLFLLLFIVYCFSFIVYYLLFIVYVTMVTVVFNCFCYCLFFIVYCYCSCNHDYWLLLLYRGYRFESTMPYFAVFDSMIYVLDILWSSYSNNYLLAFNFIQVLVLAGLQLFLFGYFVKMSNFDVKRLKRVKTALPKILKGKHELYVSSCCSLF